jgi:hypothetical protein
MMLFTPNGSLVEPKGVLSKWYNDCGVLVMENIRLSSLIGLLFPKMRKKTLWELMKAHYIFPSNSKELVKSATRLTIGRALQRFRLELNKFYD